MALAEACKTMHIKARITPKLYFSFLQTVVGCRIGSYSTLEWQANEQQ